eukprot:TRINITY_DN11735_c1_g4_i5.p2 TRINITY_DN11735_c1_g4~~TRINITY_DN11735_c1_g4_i5.p2  ORF type:complete len:100 (-),score=5.14 TRINITY_DN11735_c1_g4_i5:582-881(-)
MPTDLVSISIALTTVLTTRMCFPEADRDVLSDHNSRPNSDTDEEAQSPAETTQTYAAPRRVICCGLLSRLKLPIVWSAGSISGREWLLSTTLTMMTTMS